MHQSYVHVHELGVCACYVMHGYLYILQISLAKARGRADGLMSYMCLQPILLVVGLYGNDLPAHVSHVVLHICTLTIAYGPDTYVRLLAKNRFRRIVCNIETFKL